MARAKGWKRWDGLTAPEWQAIFADKTLMSDLMMELLFLVYHAPHHTDNAKHVADRLFMEYRALNASVGWAGNKLKNRMLAVCEEKDRMALSAMDPWQYIFDGKEDENGTYLWIIKPSMVKAFQEIEAADLSPVGDIRSILAKDISSFGAEGNLFSASGDETVQYIRDVLTARAQFFRKSLTEAPCCLVCGVKRVSLLVAVPYGETERRQKGLLFCPTHGALFAAHLISFNDRGELLLSSRIEEDEAGQLGLVKGSAAHGTFSHRRMALHRKIWNEEGRRQK